MQGNPWTPESLTAVQDWTELTRARPWLAEAGKISLQIWAVFSARHSPVTFHENYFWKATRGKKAEPVSSLIISGCRSCAPERKAEVQSFALVPDKLQGSRQGYAGNEKSCEFFFFFSRRIFEVKMPAAFDNALFISRVLFSQQRRESPDFPPWGISRLPSETNYSSMALIGLSEPGEKPGLCNHFQEAIYSL